MKINEILNGKVEQVRETLDFEVTSYKSSARLLQTYLMYVVSTNNYYHFNYEQAKIIDYGWERISEMDNRF